MPAPPASSISHTRLQAVSGATSNEVRLLRRAADGDERSVRALYDTHAGRVRRTVVRVLGPHDPEIDDVVQRVFLAALDGAGRFRGDARLSTWLMGIAARRALDERRARHRRTRWQSVTERVGVGSGPWRPDQRHEARVEAERLLGLLTPEQRDVLVLKEFEGHTYQEIRDMTGAGISTLHARLQAARRRLAAG
ncbi:MAG: RNA polymerase sigma factor [Myxococcota bacterium]